jgi:hypothetical protein
MPTEEEFDPSEANPFVSGQDTFDEASQRARSVVTPDSKTPQEKSGHWAELSSGERKKLIGVTASGAALIAISSVALPNVVEAIKGPDYSHETTTYTVQPGDGWYNVADAVKGHETINTNVLIDHLKGDPANIDVVTRGELQPGETITIPISVKP